MDEKGFNEDELSDIMKEIEALEGDFKKEQSQMTPVVGELAKLDEKVAVPSKASKKSEVVEFNKSAGSGSKFPTSMNFKVQGEMSIDLQFDVGGKVVHLAVSETGLNVSMDGGVTFSVPFEKNHKKSA